VRRDERRPEGRRLEHAQTPLLADAGLLAEDGLLVEAGQPKVRRDELRRILRDPFFQRTRSVDGARENVAQFGA
jgi:hypothetical protein